MREIRSVPLKDEAQIGAARRAVHFFARQQGFTEQALAEIDLVVQEIGTNAVRYATDGGFLHYAETHAPHSTHLTHVGLKGLELFYWDKGPGIYDPERAMRDGVSTGGSLGGGFGAISRQMDQFEIYSTVRTTGRLSLGSPRYSTHGTALLCRKWTDREEDLLLASKQGNIGVWSRPREGEHFNGDAYFIREHGEQTLYAVIDGLGHGHGAKQAADAAGASLNEWTTESLEDVFLFVHQALKATRGAVMGAIVVDRAERRIHYAGVGNIDVRVLPDEVGSPARFISNNGTLGLRLDKVRVWSSAWRPRSWIVMTTDGISVNWDFKAYPNLIEKDPQILAGLLVRDFGRDSDDATSLVIALE